MKTNFFKVWLAGPTTMVVGLVLAGKVVIDWGPAMLHAREGSIDSRLFDQVICNTRSNVFKDNHYKFQLHQPAPSRYPEPLRPQTVNQMRIEHEPKCNGSGSSPASFVQYNNNNAQSPIGYRPPMQFIHSPVSENGIPRMVHTGGRLPRSSIGCIPPRQAERPSPEQCLIYSQYNASLNKLPVCQFYQVQKNVFNCWKFFHMKSKTYGLQRWWQIRLSSNKHLILVRFSCVEVLNFYNLTRQNKASVKKNTLNF